jgi:protein-S-isoprenylcysteine O-methyltransferase Ste14
MFFMIPLLWSIYPKLYHLLPLLIDPVPKALTYLGIGFLSFGTIWSLIPVVQLKAFRKSHGNRRLHTNGLFSVSRNPITFGIYCTSVGLALILPSEAMIAGLLLTILHFHRRTKLEEIYLESVHGVTYATYKTKVARYLGRRTINLR